MSGMRRTWRSCLVGACWVIAAAATQSAQAANTLHIKVADGDNNLLPRASVAVVLQNGGIVKATPSGYGEWFVKQPADKVSIKVADRSVGGGIVELTLPNADEVSVIVYIEGKSARLEVVAPRPAGKKQILGSDFAGAVLRGAPIPASLQKVAPPAGQQSRGPSPAGGDTCGTATVIPSIPFLGLGDTTGAADDYDEICPFNTPGSGDHVYSFTPAADISVAINLCGSSYDTKVYVYDNACGAFQSGSQIACNDDGCPGAPPEAYRSQIDCLALTAGHTYYIVVDGYFGETGAYSVDITECTACAVTCDPGKIAENEPNCGLPDDTVNGGCNSVPPVFSPISCGGAYCATGAFDGASRDTDWYRVVLASEQQVTWTVTAEFDVVAGIVDNFGIDSCAGVTSFLTFAVGGPCDEVTVTACLPAGTWYLFVAPDFTDILGCGAEYNAELTCASCPIGACCLGNGTCLPDLNSAACANQGGTYQGDGSSCTPNPCPQPPANDDCDTAITVAVGGSATGSTVVANPDAAPSCNGVAVAAPGVWYKVVGNGNTLTASLCNPGTDYDTRIHVYCGDCLGLACVAGDDDFCGYPPGYSEVSWCSDVGVEYFILVNGFGGLTGNFELTIADGAACGSPPSCVVTCGDGIGDCCVAHPNTGCEDPACCQAVCTFDPFCCEVEWDGICAGEAEDLCPACAPEPCDLTCDPGKTPEGEPDCGLPDDTVNGGCNSVPPVFSPISCGESYCATGAFDGSSRDTDWYRVVLGSAQQVTWTVTAEFDVLVGIVDNFGIDSCAGVSSFLTFAVGAPCDVTTVTACLPAGTWYLFVAPDFTDILPCGAEYNASLSCGACLTGACCLPNGTCVPDQTSAACSGQGGVYQGDNSTCTPGLCPTAPGNDLCVDAITVAIPSITAGTTVSATTDVGFPSPCGVGDAITAPGVWYEVVGDGGTMTASLCNGATAFDSKLTVYCRDCATPLCVTGIDDTCGLQSEVSWCSQAGSTYLILVHGFGGATGPFELSVSSSGACAPPTVQCGPAVGTGACCAPNGCSILTEAACATAGGTYLGDNTQCELPGPAHDYIANPGLAIPDGAPAGVQHVINVPDSFTIGDLNVDFATAHTWVGDLMITITHNATSVTIVNQPGDATDVPGTPFGCGQPGYDIVLDDEGSGGAIEGLCTAGLTSPPNYTPNNPLSAFDGQNAQGAWTITVVDTAGFDTGNLDQWSLHFTEPGEDACEPRGACCIHPSCQILTQAECALAGGTYSGDNTACTTPGQTTVYAASPNLAIPDGAPAGVQHVINVPDATTIADVNIDFATDHTWVGDLTITVTHNATSVTIVNQPGDATDVPGAPFGCNQPNYDIILDDEGAGGTIEGLCNGAMVSPPNYTPNNPLSAFDGMNASGAWTITVVDTAGFDSGALLSWSVHIAGAGQDTCVFTGACCDRATGDCTEDVLQAACSGPMQNWYKAQQCSEIEPPCQVCGNGIVEGTEQCDGGVCCTPTCTFVAAGTSCRASAGVCDVAESCTGQGSACPPDGFAAAGTSCRASAGVCDVAETCTGQGVNCPPDGFAPSSQECRGSAGVCDVAENCSGSGAACPADGFVAAGQTCRPAQGDCDVAEACTGSGADCPANGFASGNVCRPSTGDCDPAETCSGQDAICPSDSTITLCINGDGCCPSGCTDATDNDCEPSSIPTMGEWGLAVLTLLLLVAGKLYFGRREEVVA